MSLTTSAPLSYRPPSAHSHSAMGAYPSGDDRSYGTYYSRPHGSAHGPPPHEVQSPQRLHSSQGYVKGSNPPPQSPYQTQEVAPPGSSHGYPPQPPITPLSGPTYPPQPPPSGSYYGLAQTPDQPIPSPPPTSNGRPDSANFTPDGLPIVPVGVSGGKMFRCRGYGECDKVFTRSEHLARHVRKHTGERPFPCHCGKAFSRLDNLRQHSATVHADQGTLNEAMLNSLAPVHAALSQRANRDQRKRGEVVEVPKNAVERPRHNEGYRHKSSPGSQVGDSPYAPYGQDEQQWNVPPPQHARPRTSGGYDYPYQPVENFPPHHAIPQGDTAGPSRRPASSAGYPSYEPVYHDQVPRPPTAPGTASSTESMSQLPYPYRPMSSTGRELPVPTHYAESEPPSSAHGPPQSPMYPPGVPQATWSSPPPHSAYPPHEQTHYPPAEGYSYPPEHGQHYGPPPPGSSGGSYNYPPTTGYYPQQGQYNAVHPVTTPTQYPPGYTAPPGSAESPFSYNTPQDQSYSYGQFDSRKRRSEYDTDDAGRKHPRTSSAVAQPAPQHLGEMITAPRQGDALWLPPASERRSSLAISALLGSPQHGPRSRPQTADVQVQQHVAYGQPGGYAYQPHPDSSSTSSLPATPGANGTPRKGREDVKYEASDSMEQKAKALLGGQGS